MMRQSSTSNRLSQGQRKPPCHVTRLSGHACKRPGCRAWRRCLTCSAIRNAASAPCTLPAVAATTNVSADHLAALGPTLTDIAAHKAGIIKPGTPVVTAASDDVFSVIAEEARQQDAPLARVVEGQTYQVRSMDRSSTVF